MGKGDKRRSGEDTVKFRENWDNCVCPICSGQREIFQDICKGCEETFFKKGTERMLPYHWWESNFTIGIDRGKE